jgi:hypothetical protein
MSYELSDATIAEAYLSDRVRNGYGSSSEDLLDSVDDYLDRVGLTWRSAAAVARAVGKLTSQPPAPRSEPQPAPAQDPGEELAFADNQMQGVGNQRTLPDVSGWSLEEYARARSQLGIGRGSDQGLGGFVRAGEYA